MNNSLAAQARSGRGPQRLPDRAEGDVRVRDGKKAKIEDEPGGRFGERPVSDRMSKGLPGGANRSRKAGSKPSEHRQPTSKAQPAHRQSKCQGYETRRTGDSLAGSFRETLANGSRTSTRISRPLDPPVGRPHPVTERSCRAPLNSRDTTARIRPEFVTRFK
jgi:hypothetical protein